MRRLIGQASSIVKGMVLCPRMQHPLTSRRIEQATQMTHVCQARAEHQSKFAERVVCQPVQKAVILPLIDRQLIGPVIW